MTTTYENEQKLKLMPHVKDVEYWRGTLATNSGNGYHVELVDGYEFEGAHIIIEQTFADVVKALKRVTPGTCPECAALINIGGQLHWNKLERVNAQAGMIVSYRSTSQWFDRGKIVSINGVRVVVKWDRSPDDTLEHADNLYAWTTQPTDPRDTFNG